MQSIILIKPQSFIDVITNSSSEIFVCDKRHSVEFVRDFLKSLLETHSTNEGIEYKFDECFGDIYTITEENVDSFIDDIVIGWELIYYDWGVDAVPGWYSLYNKYPNLSWKERQEIQDRKIAEWKEANLAKARQAALGMVVIRDANDNSIPYDLWDTIESTLNAERRHLG